MGDASKPVDRETLYNEVWTEPVTVVAQRYGLSDVGLAKICRSLAIPLPSRGYWAKIKAGKIMGRAPLPALKQLGPRTWKDTPRTQLELRLGEIVGGILALAQEAHAKEMDEARQAARLRAYVKALEESLKADCGVISVEQREWLAWARAKADGLDPLIHVSDPILGAPEPTRSNW
jgi:hypothetical protein